jgi:hypothetical protein
MSYRSPLASGPQPLEPEQGPPAPEDAPLESAVLPFDADIESSPYKIDPAFLLIIVGLLAILGMNSLEIDVRYTLLWGLALLIAVLSLAVDRLAVEPLTLRGLLVGLGAGLLIGLPVFGVVPEALQRLSLELFNARFSPAFVAQLTLLTAPMAETLCFRVALHTTRGPLFAGLAACLWSALVFVPRLNFQFPLVALAIVAALAATNLYYTYVRVRFGVFASWMCQLTVNLLLLFAVRLA